MRILQVTNIVSHHQLPLARCLASLVGYDNFRFVATRPPLDERQMLGWDINESEPWVFRCGDSAADRAQFSHLWQNADVVICGERMLDFIKWRLNHQKLTFYMSERWWKPPIGMLRLLHPRFAAMATIFTSLASSPLFHFLPAGYYAAVDMRRIAPFKERIWRWGYFTSTPSPLPPCSRSEKHVKVLWAGRMLDWKRVDTLVKAFAAFSRTQPDATLTLVGDGPERKKLEKLAGSILTNGSYIFLPSRSVSDILQLMREHHIYVLSSNAYEGWGAVINEAMGEGCTVIASDAAGAAKSIIRHGENGLLFCPGDWKALSQLLCDAARDETMRMRLAQNGQRTISDIWSPVIAAERLHSVCVAILDKKLAPIYTEGPMSAA